MQENAVSNLINIFLKSELKYFENAVSQDFNLEDIYAEDVLTAVLISQKSDTSVSSISSNDIFTSVSLEPSLIKSMINISTTQDKRITFFSLGIESLVEELGRIVFPLNQYFFPRRFIVGGSISNDHARIKRHCDDADVFIIQLQGRRKWTVCDKKYIKDSILDDVLNGRGSFIKEEDTDPGMEKDFLLSAGDGLYIPSLFSHSALSSRDELVDGLVISVSIIGELLTLRTFFNLFLEGSGYTISSAGYQQSGMVIEHRLYEQIVNSERIEWITNLLIQRGLIEKN